jgi:lincosamide and streptogramin A transport system ATP-binding/permease protein
MSQISINKLYFHFDQPYQEIFTDLSLSISTDWKAALIGRNGRGKTTLFKLIADNVKPVSGNLTIPVDVKYFPYSPQNKNEITQKVIKESIAPFSLWEEKMNELLNAGDSESIKLYSEYLDKFMFYDGYTIDSIMEKEAAKIGLNEEILARPFNTLSGGEMTRALILPVFLRKDCYPLIDEPTDHLDLNGREILTNYLTESKKGFLVASHDRYLLDNCIDHVISLNKTNVSIIQGNYSTWKFQNDIKEEYEQRSYDNLQREIKNLEKAASQNRKWSDIKEKEKNSAADSGFVSHKAAKKMKRAISIEKRIENNIQSKKELLKDKEITPSLKMRSSEKVPERLISVNELSVCLDNKLIISNFYMNLNRGDRIAITGENGCGKTTLLNAINGIVPICGGDIYIARNIQIARAYQNPLWNNGFLKDHLITERTDMTSFRFIMSALGLKGDIFDHPLESFSKGQLRKIDLCRTIVSSPQLLIWDEPLNYLDIDSREQLEEFISNENMSIIFVEHDRTFIENTATDIIKLERL